MNQKPFGNLSAKLAKKPDAKPEPPKKKKLEPLAFHFKKSSNC